MLSREIIPQKPSLTWLILSIDSYAIPRGDRDERKVGFRYENTQSNTRDQALLEHGMALRKMKIFVPVKFLCIYQPLLVSVQCWHNPERIKCTHAAQITTSPAASLGKPQGKKKKNWLLRPNTTPTLWPVIIYVIAAAVPLHFLICYHAPRLSRLAQSH